MYRSTPLPVIEANRFAAAKCAAAVAAATESGVKGVDGVSGKAIGVFSTPLTPVGILLLLFLSPQIFLFGIIVIDAEDDVDEKSRNLEALSMGIPLDASGDSAIEVLDVIFGAPDSISNSLSCQRMRGVSSVVN